MGILITENAEWVRDSGSTTRLYSGLYPAGEAPRSAITVLLDAETFLN